MIHGVHGVQAMSSPTWQLSFFLVDIGCFVVGGCFWLLFLWIYTRSDLHPLPLLNF